MWTLPVGSSWRLHTFPFNKKKRKESLLQGQTQCSSTTRTPWSKGAAGQLTFCFPQAAAAPANVNLQAQKPAKHASRKSSGKTF